MVGAAPPVGPGPVGGGIARPGGEATRRRVERAAEVDPLAALLKTGQGVYFNGGMADDIDQLLVAPDVAFQRRDVEIANQQSGAATLFRPARHPLDLVELLKIGRASCRERVCQYV